MGKAARIKRMKEQKLREHEIRAKRQGSPFKCAVCKVGLVDGQPVAVYRKKPTGVAGFLRNFLKTKDTRELLCMPCERKTDWSETHEPPVFSTISLSSSA